jgi:pimeloyl-ACP methyl ester carboxylesterase
LLVALALRGQPGPRLRGLVLIDSIGCLQFPPLFIAALCLPLLGPALARLAPAGWAVRTVLRQVYFDRGKITDEMVDAYAAPLRGKDRRGARAALVAAARGMIRHNLVRRLRRSGGIQVPVLVLWGAEDRIVPRHVMRCLLQALPTARSMVIDACGHAPQEECPERTLDALSHFMRG